MAFSMSTSVWGSDPYEEYTNPYPSFGPDTHFTSYAYQLPGCKLTSNVSPSTSNLRTPRRYMCQHEGFLDRGMSGNYFELYLTSNGACGRLMEMPPTLGQ